MLGLIPAYDGHGGEGERFGSEHTEVPIDGIYNYSHHVLNSIKV